MKSKYKKVYPWVVVGLLWVVALLNYMDRQMLSTMKTAMMGDIRELETAENFGRLMAVFLWIYGLVSPFAGLVADRISRKWLIVSSLAVWSGITLAMGYAQTFDQLYVLRAIMGVSEAIYIPAGLSLIADYHKGNTRSLAVGIHMTGIYMGQAFGGFGATVSSVWTWKQTFHVFGLIGIIYSIILIFLLHETRDVEIKRSSLPNFKNSLSSVKNTLGILLGNLSFWIIIFYFTAPSFPGWAVKNWIPTLFAETLHISMAVSGPLSTITTALSSLAGVIIGGILADRWIMKNIRGRIYTGTIGLGLTIPALLLLGFSHELVSIISGAILFGLGFGMFDSNNMPILCQFVSSRYRATGYGLMNMAGITAGAMITKILGKSTDSGSLGHDMAFLAIPVAVAIVFQLTMLKPTVADKQED